MDFGDTTDEEGDRVSAGLNWDDGEEEERHFGKRRMVGSYETSHVMIPRQLLQTKDEERRRLAGDGKFVDRLVPIRLELDLDGFRIKDLFTWNIDGAVLALHLGFFHVSFGGH